MNTLHVFLALVWAAAVVGTLIIGGMAVVAYAREADRLDLPINTALTGAMVRVLAICVLLALIIGVPLDVVGF